MASGREPFNMTPRPEASSVGGGVERSPWHSPVPYLFGGLAAMLGLIAFALLILACSYWKLSGYIDGVERDLESGEGGGGGDEKNGEKKKVAAEEEYEEKVLVIMAGQLNPTFLATPVSSRSSSFEKTCSCNEKLVEVEKQGNEEQSENRGSEEQSENRGSSSTITPAVEGLPVEGNTTPSH